MMRRNIAYALLCIAFGLAMYIVATRGNRTENDYLVIASESVMADSE